MCIRDSIGYARIVLVCLLGALLAVPAFAEGGASGPLDTDVYKRQIMQRINFEHGNEQ